MNLFQPMRRPALAALLALCITGPAEAQTFFQVSPTGSFYRTAFEVPSAPTVVSLADFLGASTLALKPRGQLQVAGSGSPKHDAVFCAVFSTSNQLLGSDQQQRVTGAVSSTATATSPCSTGNTLFGGTPTNITQDFFIPFVGIDVEIPNGAQYLFVSVFDDYYSDNVSPNPPQYGIEVTATVPEPASMPLLSAGVVALLMLGYRRRYEGR